MAELLFQSKQEKLADGSPIIITKILGAIDGTTVRQFEDKLIGFFNQGVKNLILIFSDVKYINSTGMGLLVKLADKFQEGGGDIKLVGVPEKVIALFDMLGLLSLFKIYETEEEAVESISQGGAKQSPPVMPSPQPTPPPPPPTVKRSAPKTPTQKPTPAGRGVTPRPSVPPKPQPKPVTPPPPSQDDMLGKGIEIGGIEIGGEEIGEEPLKPVTFPYNTNCAYCSGPIQFTNKGNFKCPRCGSYISINEFGQQTVHAGINSKVIELRCPCDLSYTPAVKTLINALAHQVNFSKIFCDEINAALDNALAITVEKSTNPKESYQVLAVADNNEMIIGIKSLNPFLVQGAPRDNRLPLIARKVDRLEVFPLPNKGQILKMTKRRK